MEKMEDKTTPIKTPEEVQESKDEKIDQDYPGFPHPPATPKRIKPGTPEEKKSAEADKKQSVKTYGGSS